MNEPHEHKISLRTVNTLIDDAKNIINESMKLESVNQPLFKEEILCLKLEAIINTINLLERKHSDLQEEKKTQNIFTKIKYDVISRLVIINKDIGFTNKKNQSHYFNKALKQAHHCYQLIDTIAELSNNYTLQLNLIFTVSEIIITKKNRTHLKIMEDMLNQLLDKITSNNNQVALESFLNRMLNFSSSALTIGKFEIGSFWLDYAFKLCSFLKYDYSTFMVSIRCIIHYCSEYKINENIVSINPRLLSEIFSYLSDAKNSIVFVNFDLEEIKNVITSLHELIDIHIIEIKNTTSNLLKMKKVNQINIYIDLCSTLLTNNLFSKNELRDLRKSLKEKEILIKTLTRNFKNNKSWKTKPSKKTSKETETPNTKFNVKNSYSENVHRYCQNYEYYQSAKNAYNNKNYKTSFNHYLKAIKAAQSKNDKFVLAMLYSELSDCLNKSATEYHKKKLFSKAAFFLRLTMENAHLAVDEIAKLKQERLDFTYDHSEIDMVYNAIMIQGKHLIEQSDKKLKHIRTLQINLSKSRDKAQARYQRQKKQWEVGKFFTEIDSRARALHECNKALKQESRIQFFNTYFQARLERAKKFFDSLKENKNSYHDVEEYYKWIQSLCKGNLQLNYTIVLEKSSLLAHKHFNAHHYLIAYNLFSEAHFAAQQIHNFTKEAEFSDYKAFAYDNYLSLKKANILGNSTVPPDQIIELRTEFTELKNLYLEAINSYENLVSQNVSNITKCSSRVAELRKFIQQIEYENESLAYSKVQSIFSPGFP